MNTALGVTTDADGRYVIDDVTPGTYDMRASYVGYSTWREQVILADGQNLVKDIILQEDALNIEGVVVSGTRYKYDRVNAPVIVNVVDNAMLDATQSIAISEGLHYQPGVRVETNCQNCGFTQVRLNGLDGAYSQILINSRAIFSALNSVYGLDQIPSNIVEQVEVVRSGGSALYGSNAIAGTINIITRDPSENNWSLKSNTALINGDAIDQSVLFNGSIVNESLTNGITFYGMTRNRGSHDANNDGFTELVRLENTVLGTKVFLKPSERSKISLDVSVLNEYRRGGDRLDLAPHFTDITEELQHATYLASLSYDLWSKNDRTFYSIYTSAQQTDRDSYYGGLDGGRTRADSLLALNAYGNTDDIALVAGGQITHYLSTDDVITLGMEQQYNNTRDDITGYERVIDQQVLTTGFYGQYEWKPTNRFTALLGARYDYTQVDGLYQVGEINNTADIKLGVLSPRVTLLYKFNDHLRVRGGYARGFRAPQAFNEDLHISSVGGEPLFVILSDDLRQETSDAFTASLNMTKNRGISQFHALLEGFYTSLQNPFTPVSTGATLPNGSIIEEVRNGVGATVSGINLETGYAYADGFAVQLGGTIQRTRYNEEQVLYVPEMGSGEQIVAVDRFVRNPDVYGYFTGHYNFSDRLDVDLTGTYTGSMLVPRVVSASGAIDLIDSNPFLDMNIKASYRITLQQDVELQISGGIKNLFNSYQNDFDIGATRDSDYIYGPMAPRSVFFSVTVGSN